MTNSTVCVPRNPDVAPDIQHASYASAWEEAHDLVVNGTHEVEVYASYGFACFGFFCSQWTHVDGTRLHPGPGIPVGTPIEKVMSGARFIRYYPYGEITRVCHLLHDNPAHIENAVEHTHANNPFPLAENVAAWREHKEHMSCLRVNRTQGRSLYSSQVYCYCEIEKGVVHSLAATNALIEKGFPSAVALHDMYLQLREFQFAPNLPVEHEILLLGKP